ncbi:BMP family ABC transporter substrate-binding protein [Deinococcus deserti]|uniref:Putative Basic membrane protein family protein n=1 Tax=Deinococcus deserti (strain DSM 17065 / CIP 109153 / LMG 22923 / VCD115) TaxID=546414 RepID=C1CYN0_DEIDV|nr:BMP family ABC transporter substrate-binding protein [Deinococcus deserti]ACO47060.1 putative Basic membrane protein family protein, precursor [Deinococcus deserti VCD115]
MKFSYLSALSLLSLVSGVSHAQSEPAIGVVLDAGGKNDRSFNQSAYQGVLRAQKDLGIKVEVFEPTTAGDVGRGIQQFSTQRKDLIIGIGFNSLESIDRAAKTNSNLRYAAVDALPTGNNTMGLRFREHEGSFLVGYLAGLSSSTGVVGFVGGMDIPLIHKFEAGFAAGVKLACPKCQVIARYLGSTPAAFNNIPGAVALAGGMKNKGADVIFAAAGGSGRGVINFVTRTQCIRAEELPAGVSFSNNTFAKVNKSVAYQKACAGNTRPMFFIGVDSNQNYLGDTDGKPATLNHGLTSMVKRVDNAVYSVIRSMVKGEPWRPGDINFSLENEGVEYAMDAYNDKLIIPAVREKVEKVKGLIISGGIKVPSK